MKPSRNSERVKLHQLKTTRRMSSEDVDLLFMHMLRFPRLLADAKMVIDDGHFSGTKEHYLKVLWMVLCDLTDRTYKDCNVPQPALRRGVKKWLAGEHPSARVVTENDAWMLMGRPIDDDEAEPGVIWEAYKLKVDVDLDIKTGEELLRQFYTERAISAAVQTLLVPDDDDTVFIDIGPQLEQVDKARQRLAMIGDSPVKSIRPKPGEFKPIALFEPDLPFLIPMMKGFAYPEVYGLMGPFGGGKTTMAIQIACRTAEYYKIRHVTTGEPLKHVLYFYYEGDENQIQVRVWSLLGQVDKDRLMQVHDLSDPSLSRKSWKPDDRPKYERLLAKQQGVALGDMDGEFERIESQLRVIEDCFHPIEMSKDRGYGGVDEIASQVAKCRDQYGWEPGMVVVDYCGIAVRKMLRHRNVDIDRHMRHGVVEFIDDLEEKVNKRFNCCSWVLHQLAGAVTSRSAGSQLRSSDAAEAKNFAERPDFCWAIGNKDDETGLTRLDLPKARRTEHTGHHVVVRLVGMFSRFDFAPDVVISSIGKFVSKDIANQVGGTLRARDPRLRRIRSELTLDAYAPGIGKVADIEEHKKK